MQSNLFFLCVILLSAKTQIYSKICRLQFHPTVDLVYWHFSKNLFFFFSEVEKYYLGLRGLVQA